MPTGPDPSFVPLTPVTQTATGQEGDHVTVVPNSGDAKPFHALDASPVEDPSHELSITLERDGDRITLIRIRCTCGRITDLACTYDPPPEPAPAPAPPEPVPLPPPAFASEPISWPQPPPLPPLITKRRKTRPRKRRKR